VAFPKVAVILRPLYMNFLLYDISGSHVNVFEDGDVNVSYSKPRLWFVSHVKLCPSVSHHVGFSFLFVCLCLLTCRILIPISFALPVRAEVRWKRTLSIDINVKLSHNTPMEAQGGEEVWLYSFATSALDGGEL
jgi:hypothetical protein